jgi:hypothetical protein
MIARPTTTNKCAMMKSHETNSSAEDSMKMSERSPFLVRVLASWGLLVGLFANVAFSQEKSQEKQQAIHAVWNVLDRMPQRAEVVTLALRSAIETGESKVAAESRKYGVVTVMYLGLSLGLSAEALTTIESCEQFIAFQRRARMEEVFGEESDYYLGATVVLTWRTGEEEDRAKREFEKSLAESLDSAGTLNELQLFRHKDSAKSKRLFATGQLNGRFLLAFTDAKEDLERLSSAELKKEGGLHKEVREQLQRSKAQFETTGFLQVVREPLGDQARVSAYFPSGDNAVTEIRWFRDPITPSYFPSFQDRIGKLEIPPPTWVVTPLNFSRAKEEAKILDKHSYEIRRTIADGPVSDLALFINVTRLGERPAKDPKFVMPAEWGRL